MKIRINNGFIEIDYVRVAQLLPGADEKMLRELFEGDLCACEDDDGDCE